MLVEKKVRHVAIYAAKSIGCGYFEFRSFEVESARFQLNIQIRDSCIRLRRHW